ncbi:sugar kinase [Streptomyces sp. NPDC000134]|uniref:sugar kinase n=1 Tax=Streptomyces sp. NPDC000134 TaxID=3364536 RepID=UPI0036A1154C
MTETLPHQVGPPGEARRPTEDRRHMIRRRTLTLLTIVLLIGIPAGYLMISADQSRSSGREKEMKYSATGLSAAWPSKVQRRIFQVPIPHPAGKVAYYETNNWKTSRLYAQFETTGAGLDAFLAGVGVDRSDLERGSITISDRDQDVSGWRFTGPGAWWGLTHPQKNPAPTQDIVVNLANPGLPMVYVVSRTVP